MPQIWPFALRHEHNLCKKKSCMEKCLPGPERCHGSLKGDAAHTRTRTHTQQGVNPCASGANQNIRLPKKKPTKDRKQSHINNYTSNAVYLFFLLVALTDKMQ